MNNETTSLPAISRGMHLEVNGVGGVEKLDSATLPICWGDFKDEVAQKQPSRILVVDVTERQLKEESAHIRMNVGWRYDFPLEQQMAYIQLHCPGKHHIAVIALSSEISREVARREAARYLSRDGRTYRRSIDLDHLREEVDSSMYDDSFVACDFIEIDVPEELFASEPETRFQKLLWQWVNGDSPKPIDECQYRKRFLFAFTVKPFLSLSLWMCSLLAAVCRGLFRVFTALLLTGAYVLYWFLGHQTDPYFPEIRNTLRGRRELSDGFNVRLSRHLEAREWVENKQKYFWSHLDREEVTVHRKLYAPWEFTLFVVSLVYLIYALPFVLSLVAAWWWVVLFYLAAAIFGCFAAYLVIRCMNFVTDNLLVRVFDWVTRQQVVPWVSTQRSHWKARREEKKHIEREEEKRLSETREHAYRDWLLSLKVEPGKGVNRSQLKLTPPPVSRPRQIVFNLNRVFWDTKAKVCKPFAK